MYVLYSKEHCPQCSQLEAFLKSENKEVRVLKLDVDFSREDLFAKCNEAGKPAPRSFPVLFDADGDYVGGLGDARQLHAVGML